MSYREQRAAAAPPKGAKPLSHKLYFCGGRGASGEPLGTGERFTPEVGAPRVNLATGKVDDGVFAQCVALAPMWQHRWGAAGCSVGGQLYVFGGYDGKMLERSAECYTAATGQWEALPSMDKRRSQASATAVWEKVYMSGGFDGLGELDSVLCFDTVKREWSELPPMKTRRVDHALVAIYSNLYAVGGSEDGISLPAFERFNLEPDLAQGEEPAWEELPPMMEARRGAAVCAIRTMVWVCGGHTGTRVLNTVEMYDQRTKVWEVRASMCELRFGAFASFMGEQLYVCGGHNGERPLSSIERYNFESQTWTIVVEILEPRSMAVAGLLDNPARDPLAFSQDGEELPEGERRGDGLP